MLATSLRRLRDTRRSWRRVMAGSRKVGEESVPWTGAGGARPAFCLGGMSLLRGGMAATGPSEEAALAGGGATASSAGTVPSKGEGAGLWAGGATGVVGSKEEGAGEGATRGEGESGALVVASGGRRAREGVG